MNPRIYWQYVIVSLLFFTAVLGGAACSKTVDDSDTALLLGLDHIPLAVADLDEAAERYRKLGFALKPGRTHENGIQNQHVKFPDGTEIELISTSKARDTLTAEYLKYLASGDGPAFVGFYAPDMDRLASRLDAVGKPYRIGDGLLSFPESDELRHIFFGQRAQSTTDQPAHFGHLNGADALIGVWVAGDDLTAELKLLTSLGAEFSEQEVYVPEGVMAIVAELQQAELVFLPGSWQLVPGRRIVGATIRTSDLEALRGVLMAASLDVPPVLLTNNGLSMFISPDIAHGIWLEFRQDVDN